MRHLLNVIAFFIANFFFYFIFKGNHLLAPHQEMAQTFDYSNGSAVVQGRIIYYSPNCTRPVIIPLRPVYPSDPFYHCRLNASMFKQPVWWSYGWAWQSFIPLSPSFVFTPFEPLCAMPHIEEVTFTYTTEQSEDVWRETHFRTIACFQTMKTGRFTIITMISSWHAKRGRKS